MKEKIEEAVMGALAALGFSDTKGVVVEYVSELDHGDLATNAAMVGAKALGMSPKELAEKLLPSIQKVEGVEKVEVAGPGFINVTIETEILKETVEGAGKENWGKNESLSGKRVMVEYTDPNPFKEFHIGHLMSNAIGESIARLTEYTGAETKRANYQGDVGPHVAKAIRGLQIMQQMNEIRMDIATGQPVLSASDLGRAYRIGAEEYEKSDSEKANVQEINNIVYKFRADVESGWVSKWYEIGRKVSLEHFDAIYQVLGTKFDYYFYESETAPIGIELVKQHGEIFEESDGAIVYKGEKDGLHTRVFITSHGTPTYETKDLGLLKLKADTWESDISVYVTAHEQQEYFKVMLAAAQRFMPELASKAVHITHGMMRLATGKMSSRTGDVITGESLLEDLTEAARERAKESKAEDPEKLASDIAVAAIKYQILKQTIGKDIVFDKEKALSLEGDSGPYIQYAYARTQSIQSSAREVGVFPKVDIPTTEGERKVAALLMRFPDVVRRAQEEYEPHHVATYAIALASLYNSWYAQERILDSDRASGRVALTEAVGNTLKTALYLLGIPAPEKM